MMKCFKINPYVAIYLKSENASYYDAEKWPCGSVRRHREFASGVCPRIVDDTLPTTPSYLQTHVPENLIVL